MSMGWPFYQPRFIHYRQDKSIEVIWIRILSHIEKEKSLKELQNADPYEG